MSIESMGDPNVLVKRRIDETIEMARSGWPILLKDLPMVTSQKKQLKEYWKSLTPDFRIEA